MHYKREQVSMNVDFIEVSLEEFEIANKMFKEAIQNKFPNLNLNDVEYNTVVITDGRFSAEFRVIKGNKNS